MDGDEWASYVTEIWNFNMRNLVEDSTMISTSILRNSCDATRAQSPKNLFSFKITFQALPTHFQLYDSLRTSQCTNNHPMLHQLLADRHAHGRWRTYTHSIKREKFQYFYHRASSFSTMIFIFFDSRTCDDSHATKPLVHFSLIYLTIAGDL